MAGLTLDSGALIAFERGDRSVVAILKEAQLRGVELTVPTVVVAEVWRGGPRSAQIARLLAACRIEPLLDDLARVAGETVATTKGADVIDAIVVASAGARGDAVLTSDRHDLERLQARFPAVRVVPI